MKSAGKFFADAYYKALAFFVNDPKTAKEAEKVMDNSPQFRQVVDSDKPKSAILENTEGEEL